MSFADARGLQGRYGAPFAFAVLGGALFTGLGTFGLTVLDDAPHFDIPSLALISLFASVIAAPVIGLAAAIVGLPLTWLLERKRLERPWVYPLAGFDAGAALVTLTPVLSGDVRGDTILEFLPYAWVGALPGCVCGTIWWLAYRRHLQEFGDERG